jgi:high-affinity nickel-transport protein
MYTSLTAAIGLGLLLSRHRSLGRACALGAFWGAGHTAALLAAGVAVLGFRLSVSPRLEQGLETAVACVLILLGGHVLLRATGTLLLHRHAHAHDGATHGHAHLHLGSATAGHVHLLRLGSRPFLVGLLHGLAGSAALTLVVLSSIPSAVGGLVYLFVFGIGSTAGMLLLSGLIGLPFALTAERSARAQGILQLVAGLASLGLGLALVAGAA